MICRGLWIASRDFHQTAAESPSGDKWARLRLGVAFIHKSLYVMGWWWNEFVGRASARNRIKMFSLGDDFVTFGRQSNYHTQ